MREIQNGAVTERPLRPLVHRLRLPVKDFVRSRDEGLFKFRICATKENGSVPGNVDVTEGFHEEGVGLPASCSAAVKELECVGVLVKGVLTTTLRLPDEGVVLGLGVEVGFELVVLLHCFAESVGGSFGLAETVIHSLRNWGEGARILGILVEGDGFTGMARFEHTRGSVVYFNL